MAKNHYETLGVQKTATQDEIKSAYRKLARQYHPDLHPNDEECAKKFKEINEANEILSDPDKRKQYDFELENPGAGSFGGFGGFGGGQGGFGGGGFSSIFDDLMGGFFGGGGREDSTSKAGKSIKIDLDLSFLDAAKGCKKEVKYVRDEPCKACRSTGAKNGTAYTPCSKCNGEGTIQYVNSNGFFRTVSRKACDACSGKGKIIQERCSSCNGKGYQKTTTTVNLDIPAGADTGSYMQKRGFGNASPFGGPAGDLIVEFRVLPHKIFKRKNFNLYVDLPIDYKTAVLGGKVKVPTLDETIEIEIPEGTEHGTQLLVRNKGIKTQRGTGHLYVNVLIEIPTRLSKKQKQMLEDFDESVEIKQCENMKKYSDSVESLYGDKPYKKKK
ncbi:MAG: molecular chaperone DnaJ [Clostridia bacterium]|nr:molecular chaperone DnaJ [Clostridia bacterium]